MLSEKDASQAAFMLRTPSLPSTVVVLKPWKTGAEDVSKTVIRLSLSLIAAATAEKLEFISDALVVAPAEKELGIETESATIADGKPKIPKFITRANPTPLLFFISVTPRICIPGTVVPNTRI